MKSSWSASCVYWRGVPILLIRKFSDNEISEINLLTIQEVAAWAKVSRKTVYRWISDSKIATIRLGNGTYRTPEKAIIAYLRKIGYEHLVE
jgi:excisionase family DNA binding protein